MISESLVAENSEKKPDIRNIEEAELSLRESSSLNYKEARALLGRIEYQKGNIEAALHVFEAAQTCKVILDIVESSIPQGLPENFSADCKLQETLNEAVEMLPELWKCSDSPHEAILSYRQALLHQWNLDAETIARIQKQFAIFLLYYGGEALPPNLCSQMDSSFIPRNNIEEAILLRGSFDTFKVSSTDFERVARWSKALQTLEKARNITSMKDPNILYHLSLENVEQRKLEGALYYAKSLLKLEGGFNIKGWLLLGRVLSAQKRFVDSETILNASLDQTGKWDQRELLHTKVKIQLAQGQLRNAFDTYTELLGILHVQNKSFGSGKKLHKDCGCYSRSFEQEIWHDLAYLYISLSRWKDAEICLSKSNAISSFSAVRNHATGLLYERKGLLKEALKAFQSALGIDLDHAPSLISAAGVLRQLKCQPDAVVKSFLMNTLRVDRMNPSAWYNLGLLLKAEGTPLSLEEAAECFQAAAILGELGTRLLIHSD
ncbi:hypothetical protein GOBAR_DD11417 [Gossypium barbadense]|nr:hypothetical protein GOBAR_DD11417 [Gossypium barbadense]